MLLSWNRVEEIVPFVYRYQAYGLRVESDRALPGLIPCDDEQVDVTITFVGDCVALGGDTSGQLVYPKTSSDQSILRVWRTANGGLRLTASYRGEYCTFVVEPGGAQVRVAWSPVTPVQDVLLYLLGPVLGSVLRMRGATCLHGSAVAYQGQAAVLIGPKGAGKSTTAAALLERGCKMLTDDIAVIREADGQFYVEPGYPGMRLRDTSAAHLYGTADALPGLWSDAPDRALVQRRYLDLQERSEQFSAQALPLAAVYVLEGRGPAETPPRVHALPCAPGLLMLAANTYVDYAHTEASRVQEWRGLERLLRAVPARRVIRPDGLGSLDGICEALLGDLRALNPVGAE